MGIPIENRGPGYHQVILKRLRPVLMVVEYTSEKGAHAHSVENVKKLTVTGTKSAPKKVEVSGVSF